MIYYVYNSHVKIPLHSIKLLLTVILMTSVNLINFQYDVRDEKDL